MIDMATPSPAARLVTAAAQEALRPLGVRQRGRSRVWLDDQGWWLGVIEFRAGSSEGSHLDVGGMWLWQPADYLRFDFGGREGDFQRFVNPDQFAKDVRDLTQRARTIVTENRERFSSIHATAAGLLAQQSRGGYFWENYHAAIAAALAGDAAGSRQRFTAVLAEDPFAPWINEVQQTARDLSDLAVDTDAFRRWAVAMVTRCRDQLKLAPRTISFDDA
ncbi:hypothetical protein [Catenulispora subtropica]|uniref:DUF4304 domain-containing protein n=1 Tax=Catenulispora subtropica TaxID=450798 RepID=A0ABN2SWZ0_9ACTN